MILIATIFCLLLCIPVKWIFTRMHKYKRSGIPAPDALKLFIKLLITKFDFIKTYQLLNKKYGDIFRNFTFIFLRSPEYLEVLFTNPALQQRPKLTFVDDVATGEPNLLTAGPDRSRILKKLYYRCFVNVSHIESLKKSGDFLLSHLHENVGKRWFLIEECINNAVTESAIRTSFGTEAKDYPKLLGLIQNLEKNQMLFILRLISPIHRNDFLFYNFLGGREKMQEIATLHQIISDIVKKKQKEMEEYKKSGEEIPNNFLFGLLREKETDGEIGVKAEMLTLAGTAFGTTEVNIAYALLMLAIHPEVQRKVFEEDKRIQEELEGREMDDRDLSKYDYLQRVIKETLRLYPAFASTIRYATADVQIGKYTIPRGAKVVGAHLSVQRDPELFHEPLKFDPDRFLPENAKKIHKYSYVPFSIGLRSCPGSRYATLTATYFISRIVRNFQISTKYQSVEEVDENLGLEMVLHDKNSFPVCLEIRSK